MSTAEKKAGLMDDLAFALDQAQGGNYTEALRLVGRAKIVDPRNIFLIALEKQLGRLRGGGMLPKEKIELLQSLPGLVDRARADGERRGVAQPAPQVSDADEKRVKLQLVLDQYFQHADEWLAKGDAATAVKEIDRVLLIDPSNRRAREYRARVDSILAAANAKTAAVPPEPVPQAPDAVPDMVGEPEPLPLPLPQTDEDDSNAGEKAPAPRKRFIVWSVAGILLALGLAGYFLLRGDAEEETSTVSSPAPVQQAEPSRTPAVEQTQTLPEVQKEELPAEPPPVVVVPSPPRAEKKTAVATRQPAGGRDRVPEQVQNEPPPRLEESQPTSVSTPVKRPAAETANAPFIPVEKEPRILQLTQPVFTEDDHSAGVKGQIVIKVQIDRNGRPIQAKVVSSSNPILNNPVVDAVMRSSFTPAIMSSGPVVSWMTIPFKFK